MADYTFSVGDKVHWFDIGLTLQDGVSAFRYTGAVVEVLPPGRGLIKCKPFGGSERFVTLGHCFPTIQGLEVGLRGTLMTLESKIAASIRREVLNCMKLESLTDTDGTS